MPESKKPVNIKALLERIDFSPDRVIEAEAESAALFVKAAEHRCNCMEARMNAEMEWQRARADKDQALRKQARALDEKITEDSIKAQILLDKNVNKLLQEFNKSEVHEEYSKLLLKTFQMRSDCAQAISYATKKEMDLQMAAEAGMAKLNKARQDATDRFPED